MLLYTVLEHCSQSSCIALGLSTIGIFAVVHVGGLLCMMSIILPSLQESWNPMWTVASILTGLLSFMLESQITTGSLETTVSAQC